MSDSAATKKRRREKSGSARLSNLFSEHVKKEKTPAVSAEDLLKNKKKESKTDTYLNAKHVALASDSKFNNDEAKKTQQKPSHPVQTVKVATDEKIESATDIIPSTTKPKTVRKTQKQVDTTTADMKVVMATMVTKVPLKHPADVVMAESGQVEEPKAPRRTKMFDMSVEGNTNNTIFQKAAYVQRIQSLDFWFDCGRTANIAREALFPPDGSTPVPDPDDTFMECHEVTRDHINEYLTTYLQSDPLDNACSNFNKHVRSAEMTQLLAKDDPTYKEVESITGCMTSAMLFYVAHEMCETGTIPGRSYRSPNDVLKGIKRVGECLACYWKNTCSYIFDIHQLQSPSGGPINIKTGSKFPFVVNIFRVKVGPGEFREADCVSNPKNLVYGNVPRFSLNAFQPVSYPNGRAGFVITLPYFSGRSKQEAPVLIDPFVRFLLKPDLTKSVTRVLLPRLWPHKFPQLMPVEYFDNFNTAVYFLRDLLLKKQQNPKFGLADRVYDVVFKSWHVYPPYKENDIGYCFYPQFEKCPPIDDNHLIIWTWMIRVKLAHLLYKQTCNVKQCQEFSPAEHLLRLFVQQHNPLGELIISLNYPDDQVLINHPRWQEVHPTQVETTLPPIDPTFVEHLSYIKKVYKKMTPSSIIMETLHKLQLPATFSGLAQSDLEFILSDDFYYTSETIQLIIKTRTVFAKELLRRYDNNHPKNQIIRNYINYDSLNWIKTALDNTRAHKLATAVYCRVFVAYVLLHEILLKSHVFRICTALSSFDLIEGSTIEGINVVDSFVVKNTKASAESEKQTDTNLRIRQKNRVFHLEMIKHTLNPLMVPHAPLKNNKNNIFCFRRVIRREHRVLYNAIQQFIRDHLACMHLLTQLHVHNKVSDDALLTRRGSQFPCSSYIQTVAPRPYSCINSGCLQDLSYEVTMICLTNKGEFDDKKASPFFLQNWMSSFANVHNCQMITKPVDIMMDTDPTFFKWLKTIVYLSMLGAYPHSCVTIPIKNLVHIYGYYGSGTADSMSDVAWKKLIYHNSKLIEVAVREYQIYITNFNPMARTAMHKEKSGIDVSMALALVHADDIRIYNSAFRTSDAADVTATLQLTSMISSFRFCYWKLNQEKSFVHTTPTLKYSTQEAAEIIDRAAKLPLARSSEATTETVTRKGRPPVQSKIDFSIGKIVDVSLLKDDSYTQVKMDEDEVALNAHANQNILNKVAKLQTTAYENIMALMESVHQMERKPTNVEIRQRQFFSLIRQICDIFTSKPHVRKNFKTLNETTMPVGYNLKSAFEFVTNKLNAADDVVKLPAWLEEFDLNWTIDETVEKMPINTVPPIGSDEYFKLPPAKRRRLRKYDELNLEDKFAQEMELATYLQGADTFYNLRNVQRRLFVKTARPMYMIPLWHVTYEINDALAVAVRQQVRMNPSHMKIDFREFMRFGLSAEIVQKLRLGEEELCIYPTRASMIQLKGIEPFQLWLVYSIVDLYKQHYSIRPFFCNDPQLIKNQVFAICRMFRVEPTQITSSMTNFCLTYGQITDAAFLTSIGGKDISQNTYTGELEDNKKSVVGSKTYKNDIDSGCMLVPVTGCFVLFPNNKFKLPPKMVFQRPLDKGTMSMRQLGKSTKKKNGNGGLGSLDRCSVDTKYAPQFMCFGIDTRCSKQRGQYVACRTPLGVSQFHELDTLVMADCCGNRVKYCREIFVPGYSIMWCGVCFSPERTRFMSRQCDECKKMLFKMDDLKSDEYTKTTLVLDTVTFVFVNHHYCDTCAEQRQKR